MQKRQSTATPVYDYSSTATPAVAPVAGGRYDPRPYPERNDERVVALEAEVARLSAELANLKAQIGGGVTVRFNQHTGDSEVLRTWSQDSVE